MIGCGYMGGGIAQTIALAGLECRVWDADADRARTGVQRLQEEGMRLEQLGLFPQGAAVLLEENLVAASSMEDAVGEAAYITEAVPENADLKHDVLQQVEACAPEYSTITSNTSAIPIADLGSRLRHPERFLGVHWMNPSYFVPCVEVIPFVGTEEVVVEAVVQLLRSWGKAPTRVADSPGFVANRLQYALFKESTRLVEEGTATAAQVDEVVRNSFGFRLPFFGPFAIADIAGLDVYLGSFRTMEAAYGERMQVPESLRAHVAQGRLGLKSGGGFRDFQQGRAQAVATHRDRAYAGLNELRARVGDVAFVDDDGAS